MIQRLTVRGIAGASLLGLVACSGAPSCSDPQVLEMIVREHQDQLRIRYTNGSIYTASYNDLVRSAPADPAVAKVLAEIEEDVRNSRIDISGIRTISSENGIAQCGCSITVGMFMGRRFGEELNKEHTVVNFGYEYTAQYSDDGSELFVQGREIR